MPKPVKKFETFLESWENLETGVGVQNLHDFIVFAQHQYYPSGGLDDILVSFETFEQAKAFIETSYTIDKRDGSKHWGWDRFQIVRKIDWVTVYEARVSHREISTA